MDSVFAKMHARTSFLTIARMLDPQVEIQTLVGSEFH
jgi:hypothetical protein